MNFTKCTHANDSVEGYLQHLQDKTNLTLIPAVIMLSIFAVTGLIGNILVLVVYSKKFSLNATKVLIMTIASFDLVANVGAIPSAVSTMFNSWNFSSPGVCKIQAFLGSFTTVGGAMSLLAVAVVRYRKVCRPHEWQVTIKQAIFASLAAAFIALLVSIPYTIIYGVKTKETPCANIKGYECFADDHYFYTIWPLMNNLLFILLYVALSSSIVILYTLIGVTAWKHSKQRHFITTCSKQKKDVDFTNTGPAVGIENKPSKRQRQPSDLTNQGLVADVEQIETNSANNRRLMTVLCCLRQRGSRSSSYASQTPIVLNAFASTADSDTTEHSRSISSEENSQNITHSEEISIEVTSSGVINHKVTHSDIGCNVESSEDKNHTTYMNSAYKAESSLSMFVKPSAPSNQFVAQINEPIHDTLDQPQTSQGNIEKNPRESSVGNKFTQNTETTLNSSHCKNEQIAEKHKKELQTVTPKRASKSNSLCTNSKTIRSKALGRMTAMLIIISAIFVFGFIPFLVLSILQNRWRDKYANLNTVELSIFNFFYRLYFVNSAANPIIYSLCNIKFRSACKRLFTHRPRRRL